MGRNNVGSVARAGGSTQNSSSGFSRFDGHRVAVVLKQDKDPLIFRGVAHVQRDDQMGSVVRVVDQINPGNPVLIIAEKNWHGLIVPDVSYGCEFCMVPFGGQGD